MAEEKPKAVQCPNCQGPAIRTGNEITCESCDAIFTITKKDGAKVRELGPIKDHDERLKRIEAKIFPGRLPDPEQPAAEPEQESENDSADQSDPILGTR